MNLFWKMRNANHVLDFGVRLAFVVESWTMG